MLIYGQESILIMDYGKHEGFIMERLLKIIEKVP